MLFMSGLPPPSILGESPFHAGENTLLNLMGVYCSFFFFSSRRRHTRFKCDWSSDVCSSDLGQQIVRLWLSLLPAGILPAGQQARQVGTVLHKPVQALPELRNGFHLLLLKCLCRQQGNKSGHSEHFQRESPAIWQRGGVIVELVLFFP